MGLISKQIMTFEMFLCAILAGILVAILLHYVPMLRSVSGSTYIFALGAIVGFIVEAAGSDLADHDYGLGAIAFVLIPLCLGKDCLFIDWKAFYGSFSVIILTTCFNIAIVFSTSMLLFKALYPEFSYLLCAEVASIIACMPDPVAVLGVFAEIPVPASLKMMLFGEGIMNDAIDIALFENIHQANTDPKTTMMSCLITFCMLVPVAIAFGGALGLFGSVTLEYLPVHVAQMSVYFVIPFMLYYVSEYYIHCSGVLALVVFGLFIAWWRTPHRQRTGQKGLDHHAEQMMHFAVEIIEFMMFGWAGFVIAGIIISEGALKTWDYVCVPIIFIAEYFFRAFSNSLLNLVLIPCGCNAPWNFIPVYFHGAIRGSFCLFFAIYVGNYYAQKTDPTLIRFGKVCEFQVGCYVFLTSLLQGSTLYPIAKWSGVIQQEDNAEASQNV